MMRLSLVIADKDKAYVESLTGFLTDKYPQKFRVSFFTDKNHLADFLMKSGEKVEVLLISPELYDELKSCCHAFYANYKKINVNCHGINGNHQEFNTNCREFNGNYHGPGASHHEFNTEEYKEKVPVIILLVGNDVPRESYAFNTIFKYQHGDKLVSDIIGIYESKYENSGLSLKHAGKCEEYSEKKGQGDVNKTWLVSVYSPAGGAGKTTIAVNSCIQCAREGMKALYLNLESISSTPCFFECDLNNEPSNNFSTIILAAKEKNKNLYAKIEGMKLVDAVHNIHYLLPPDSSLEVEEMLPDEIKYLLREITLTGYYDVVFADLDSSLAVRNLAVMEESDNIILVHTPGIVSRQKILGFYKELGIYRRLKGVNLQEKLVLVVNRYDESIPEKIKDDIDVICATMGIEQYFKIPVGNQAAGYTGDYLRLGLHGRSRTGEQDGLTREIRKLVDKYIKAGSATVM
ncbi:MAG: AAA family ATPase [Clostridiaceae bacterium]|nr:AAA family ATPase [Clostridiaceae bacterium]